MLGGLETRRPLAAGGSETLRFNRKRLDSLEGKYLFVRVDRKKKVAESCEDNDQPWQILNWAVFGEKENGRRALRLDDSLPQSSPPKAIISLPKIH